jgi:SAM-dependent methyltransferase
LRQYIENYQFRRLETMDTITLHTKNEGEELREKVREHYGQSALRVTSGDAGCCGAGAASGCCTGVDDPISTNLYNDIEAGEVPTEALLASLGCGNPTALARLNPGETVLDLGSGGGIDVLLSARRVGPTGFAYGLDMTDEMLALAEENRKRAGVENVKFLKGYIEDIPLPDNSVDVIISNCVINLAADKAPVLREAYRVLKPGGRFAVSDIVVRGEMPAALKQSMEAWAGCIAGALHVDDYTRLLTETGFTDTGIEVTRTYTAADVTAESACCTPDQAMTQGDIDDGLFVSAFIRATKPNPTKEVKS